MRTRPTTPETLPTRRLTGGRRPSRLIAKATRAAVAATMLTLGLLGTGIATPPIAPPAPRTLALTAATLPGIAGRIAAAHNSNATVELFATTTTGALVHDWACATCAGGWSGWQTLAPGSFVGTPAATVDASGRMEVAVRTTSGQLDVFWQGAPAAGPWQGPVALGTGVTSAPAFAQWPNGRLEVFATSSTQVVHAWQGAPGVMGWSGIAGMGGAVMPGTRVAVGMNTVGTPEVFATSTAGQLMHSWFTGSGAMWTPFMTLQPQAVVGSPAVGRNADGRLEVFARAVGGSLYHTWQNAPSSGPWYSGNLGGALTSSPAVTLAHPSSNPAGVLEVFSTSANQVVAQVQAPTTAAYWTGWLDLGTAPLGAVTVSPAAAGNAPVLTVNTPQGPQQTQFSGPGTSLPPWSFAGATSFAASTTTSSFATAEVAAATAQLGMPYVWGGGSTTGPTTGTSGTVLGWDCSGLVLYAVSQASGGAISLPHNSELQATMGTAVPAGQMQPGDVIFFHIPGESGTYNHEGIYIGNGQMLDAPTPGAVVRVDTLAPYWTGLQQTVRRFG